MEAHAATAGRSTLFSPRKPLRRLLVGSALVTGAYFVARYAPGYFVLDEATYPFGGYFWDRVPWIVPHVAAGLVAIIIGPLQLWSVVRNRYRAFHRIAGRLYLAGIGVGAMSAFGLSLTAGFSPAYRSGLFSLGIVWLATTGMAFAAIRLGKTRQHREWMIRSYVVTFSFVTFRIIRDVAVANEWMTFGEASAIAAWASWALPLLLTEMVFQGREVFAAPRKARAA